MHLVVKADDQQREAFLSKNIPDGVTVNWIVTNTTVPEADAYFDLLFEEQGPAFAAIIDKPVFVNSVITTGDALPGNCIRINAWNEFLEREIIEIAVADLVADLTGGRQGSQIYEEATPILNALGWKYQQVADTPGMIAARVIAMIINEAYFGLGDEISTKTEIDTAMKLGTNYPYGPFEWGKKIGLQKIYTLLKKLYETDSRYAIAPALEKEILTK